MGEEQLVEAMRVRPVVELLRVGLVAYERAEEEFRWNARRGARASEAERALELRTELEVSAVRLGALAREALAEVLIAGRPQRTVRLLGLAVRSRVNLPVLAASDWVEPQPDGFDRVVDGPRPPARPGRLRSVTQTAHADQLRRALRSAVRAEPDIAAWFSLVVAQVLERRGATADAVRDGRPPTPATDALYGLASTASPRQSAAHPAAPPGGSALPPGESYTREAIGALAQALISEYDLAGWIAVLLREVLADLDLNATALIRAGSDEPHAIAFLRLVDPDA